MALELDLPEPLRSRVLIEMASDLEALYEHYRAQGDPEEEAARRAEQKVLASPAELHRLIAVHTSGPQRWALWLAGRMRRDLDVFLFVVCVLPVLVLSALILVPQFPWLGRDPAGWAVLGIGAGIAGLSLLSFRQLLVRADPPLEELRRRLPSLLFLGVTGLAVGALGLLAHLFALCIQLSRGPSGDASWRPAVEQLNRSATLMGSSILLAIAAGIVWFVLANRLAALERTERAFLLDE